MGTSRFVVLLVVPITVAAYVMRLLVVALLREHAPEVAGFVERWWAWLPLVVVIVLLGFVHPLLGVAAAVAAYVFLTSSRATGSPFRPRR